MTRQPAPRPADWAAAQYQPQPKDPRTRQPAEGDPVTATPKAARLRSALLGLLGEHDAAGALPTSARFLFYELVGRGVISKEKTGARRPDQAMSDALMQLRESGQVPWEAIADETRTLEATLTAPTVAGWMSRVLGQARIDPWAGGPVPMIITESRSLAGVLRPVAYKYAVPVASTNGQCGGFLHTQVAPALTGAKGPVIYLGDLDLAGDQIEANTRTVLEGYAGPLDWERLAVTAGQVTEHALPVITKHDRRYRDGRPHEAVETEALSQATLTGLLTSRLGELLPGPLDDVLEREARQRAALARLLRQEEP
jgi:hypothetical protein